MFGKNATEMILLHWYVFLPVMGFRNIDDWNNAFFYTIYIKITVMQIISQKLKFWLRKAIIITS